MDAGPLLTVSGERGRACLPSEGAMMRVGRDGVDRQVSDVSDNLLKTTDVHTLYLGECHGVGISPK